MIWVRQGQIIVIAAALVATLLACSEGKGGFSGAVKDSCEAKASRAALDESCVIEISKREIAARRGGIAYEKYTVRFDAEVNLWIVMAYNENGPPDSHTFLSITPTGGIADVQGGG